MNIIPSRALLLLFGRLGKAISALSDYCKEAFILVEAHKLIMDYRNVYKLLIYITEMIRVRVPAKQDNRNKDIMNKVFSNIEVIK